MLDKKEIGRRIKELRLKSHLTVDECCLEVGISPSAWRMYEAGQRMPRDEAKQVIAALFNRSVQFIFYRE